jgi:hypothetical protein
MSEQTRKYWVFPGLILGISALVLLAMLALTPNLSSATNSPETVGLPFDLATESPNCRFGVAITTDEQWERVSDFSVGWYLNFRVSNFPSLGEGVEYVPVVRLRQDKDGSTYLDSYSVFPPLTDAGLGAHLANKPGALWIIGNEVDRGPSPGGGGAQDDMQPEMYARAYHEVYTFIKERDPQAKVAISAMVQVTPGRLQYLDKVWAEYLRRYGQPMPVDVWNMHLYILPEVNPQGVPNGIAGVAVGTDPALGMRESGGNAALCGNLANNVYCFADHDDMNFFKAQILALRQWMKAHGQQHKPLILSEFSLLYPYDDTDGDGDPDFLRDEYGNLFDPVRVSNFLRVTFDYLDGNESINLNLGYPADNYRLVQQSLWFSLHYAGAGRASNLFTDAGLGSYSPMGEAFIQEMAERRSAGVLPNLTASNALNVAGFVIAPSTTATVTIGLDVHNNGNMNAGNPFTVTFYTDQNLQNPIGSVVIPDLNGCTQGALKVELDWADRLPGVHRYWVKVDSTQVVFESNEGDNVASGVVIINPLQTFLPLTAR